jgi:hypothetical protein
MLFGDLPGRPLAQIDHTLPLSRYDTPVRRVIRCAKSLEPVFGSPSTAPGLAALVLRHNTRALVSANYYLMCNMETQAAFQPNLSPGWPIQSWKCTVHFICYQGVVGS